MDPQAAISSGCNHASEGDLVGALENLLAYYQWRVKGGWQPVGGDVAADQLGTVIMDKLAAAQA